MRNRQRIGWALFVAAALIAALPATAGAAGKAEIAALSAGGDSVVWQPQVAGYDRLVLTVSGPDGVVHRQEFKAGEAPSFSLFDTAGFHLPDGSYTWELQVVQAGTRTRTENETDSGLTSAAFGLRPAGAGLGSTVQSGAFAIVGGDAVVAGATEPRGGAGSVTGASKAITAADQVIPDDLIVQGSICAGFDCVNGEDFGFDTLRLKENNTRLQFNDTSVGSFPTNNWQIRANSSSSGGANFLAFVDQGASGTSESGTIPFQVTAGAPANSLSVASSGRVGLRTSTPVLDLHIKTGNSPGIRLEQDTSSGFSAQTWDVAGNEANFFVRDVTGGSTLPLRIRPGAPTSSIDINGTGDVGIGTAAPSDKLHVLTTATPVEGQVHIENNSGTQADRNLLRMQNNGPPTLFFENNSIGSGAGGGTWTYTVTNAGTFQVNAAGSGNPIEMILAVGGNVTFGGTVTPGSSREIKKNFAAVDPQQVLDKLVAVPVSAWTYKAEPDSVRHLGPVAEDFYAAFGLGQDDKGISVTDAAGVAFAAIQGLHEQLVARDALIADLQARLAVLEAK